MLSPIISIFMAIFLLCTCRSLNSRNQPLIAAETVSAPTPLVQDFVQPLGEPECLKLPECPTNDIKDPYHCILYRYAGKTLWEAERLHSWGQSACQAAKTMAELACKEKKDAKWLEEVSCSPDPSLGRCPVPLNPCQETIKPSKCSARTYEKQELPWDQQPTTWGINECDAKNKLNVLSCRQGLNPDQLSNIVCESDPNPGICPPPLPNCSLTHKAPTECLVSQIGDISLKKPWTAIGTSTCEAQYRLQQMACLFSNSVNQLTPQKLGNMECRELLVTSPLPGSLESVP